MRRSYPDWFITGLFLMLFVAWLKPGIAMGAEFLNLKIIIDIGVVLIFFFYGAKLDTKRLQAGMRNWKMHTAIQLTTFLLFPLLVLPFYPFIKGTPYELMWLGVFFLAALPSTVSSSVVMVSIAGGNIPGAIFNASISGIIGIIMTPLWMSFFMTAQSYGTETGNILVHLLIQIIIPVIAGLLLHKFLARWVNRHMTMLATFDKIIILLIVYESFSRSFLDGHFMGIKWTSMVILISALIILFLIVMNITGKLADRLHFNREDKITLQYSGTKKSLVHGSVFANILFGGVSGTGVLLLPIMIYHSFQLFYISILAQKTARRELALTGSAGVTKK